MPKKIPMTGIILAGGKSSRMGKDKALLPFGKYTVLEHLGSLFGSIFEQTLMVVGDRTKYLSLDLPKGLFFEDLVKNRGPLGGLSTGFAYADYPHCFVATCDMPLIHEPFIRGMIQNWKAQTWDALCVQNAEGRWEPFPAIYKRENRSLVRILLDLGHLSMARFLEVISVDCWAMPAEYRDVMVNMNTPAEYEAVLEKKEVSCER